MSNTPLFLENPHTGAELIFAIPFVILSLFLITFLIICNKLESTPNLKTNFKSLFFLLLQFLFVPLLVFILLLNGIMILISVLFLRKLYYISSKSLMELIIRLFKKCKRKQETEVKAIKIIKNNNSSVEYDQPERANRYLEANEDSKQAERITISNKENNLNLNNKNIFDAASNTRTQTARKVKDKEQIYEFLSNALVNNKNEPSYITLLNSIKNKMKEKVENKNNINITQKINLKKNQSGNF